MTKLKNTKKGMAKKALSISLVAAMLATSNVPVWAAEDLFSDGSAAVEAPSAEVDTFSAAPVEEVPTDAPALNAVEADGNVSITEAADGKILNTSTTITASSTNIKVESNEVYAVNWYITNKQPSIADNCDGSAVNAAISAAGNVVSGTYKQTNPVNETGEYLNDVTAVADLKQFTDKYLTAVVLKDSTGSGDWVTEAVDTALIYSEDVNDYHDFTNIKLINNKNESIATKLQFNDLGDQTALSFQWYRHDGVNAPVAIDSATADNYILTKADVGYSVYPVVTVSTNNGDMTKSYEDSAVKVYSDDLKDYVESTLTVDTTSNEVGDSLSGTGYDSLHPEATVSYAWVDSNKNVLASAEDVIPSYTLQRGDIGKKIYLQATISVAGKESQTVKSTDSITVQATTTDVEVTWTGNGKELTTAANKTADFGYVYKKDCDYKPEIKSVTVGTTTYNYSTGAFNNVKWTGTDKAGTASVQFELKTDDANNGKVITLKYTIAKADLSKAEVSLSGTYVYAPNSDGLQEEALKAAKPQVILDGVALDLFGDDADVNYVLSANENGTKKGTLTITNKDSNYTGSLEYKFDVAKKDISEAFVSEIADQQYTGAYIEPAVNIYYKESDTNINVGVAQLVNTTDYTVSYKDNFKVGTATATITGIGNYTGTKTITFEIVSAKLELHELICKIYDSEEFAGKFVDKNGAKITITETDTEEKAKEILDYIQNGAYFEFTYTGYEQNPMLPAYGLNWTENKDYSYSYIGQRKNVGNFSIKVEGEGNYGSSFTLPCRIAPADIEDATIKVADTIFNEKVNASNVNDLYKPEVTVTWNGLNLIKDFDYELTYDSANSFNANKVTVKLKGIGNFAGNAEATGKIVDKSINDSSITLEAIENQKYTGEEITVDNLLKLKDGEKELILNKDFHIVEYKDNVKPGVATVVIGGLNNYTGTREITFLIVDQEYTAYILNSKTGMPVLPDVEYDYNTANSEDGFVFTVGNSKGNGDIYLADAETGDPISSDKYEVTYENNKAAGTATIKVTGKEGYQISAIGTFKINPKTLEFTENSVKFENTTETYTYTGEEIKPEVTVNLTDGKYQLVEGVDYEITYESNINAGKAKVVVTGKGNYAGLVNNELPKKELEFTINKATLTGSEVTVKDVAYAGGIEVTPDITIVNPISGKELTVGSEYTITLKNAVNVGVAEAEIKLTEAAEKNYDLTSTASKLKFNITAKDLKDVDISPIADQTVTGEQIKPAIVVMNGGVRLVEGYDYEVTYGENKEIGVGTVKITPVEGSKNYTGSKEATFNIVDEKPEVGKAEISEIIVNGNTVTPVLASEVDGAIGYDYVLATEEDYANGRVQISKNVLTTNTNFYYVEEGTYYVYCHAWKRGEDGLKQFGAWSNLMKVEVTATTPETPTITKVEKSSNGKHLRVTWTKSDNATGYDVVMGQAIRKVNGEYRPVDYGTAVKKVTNGNTVSVIFYNIPKGTYYVGLHAYNRTSESGVKVFSKWSNSKKVTF